MPTYSFKCPSETCETIIEDDASIKTYEEHHPPCPKCGGPCNYVYVPYLVHGVLKDGPTGSWPSKGERFKQYRAKQSEAAGRRQQERFGHIRKDAIPNYNGQETESWKEAQVEAMRDKGVESASTFNQKVSEEKAADKGVKL
jgi:hypothetical protein